MFCECLKSQYNTADILHMQTISANYADHICELCRPFLRTVQTISARIAEYSLAAGGNAVALGIDVRRANLTDAQAIADFVNNARSGAPVTRRNVVERFGQVGFMIAIKHGKVVGLLGWQIENLVIRVTDFLTGPVVDRVTVGRALIEAMEKEGAELLAEAAMLFLPQNPSKNLIRFWEGFDYTYQNIQDLHRAWREAVSEWNTGVDGVMVKRLRESLTNRPV
jgi:hypothetical protein